MNELIECQGDDRLALRGSDYIIKNDDDNADIPFTNKYTHKIYEGLGDGSSWG